MQQIQPREFNVSSALRRSDGLGAARYAMGGVAVLTAVVVLVIVPGDIGFTSAMAYGFGSSIGAVLVMMLLNLLYRLSARGGREREREEGARNLAEDERKGRPAAGGLRVVPRAGPGRERQRDRVRSQHNLRESVRYQLAARARTHLGRGCNRTPRPLLAGSCSTRRAAQRICFGTPFLKEGCRSARRRELGGDSGTTEGADADVGSIWKAWPRVDCRRRTTAWSSVAARSRWRATSERPRASRSRRSPTASVARRRRSRRTSTTRPARRRGRSRPATSGVCRGCGAYTQPRNGKGDAYAYCKACHPGAIERRWTRERVLDAMLRLARSLRSAAVVLRLVAHARASPWRRAARATQHRRLAFRRRRDRRLRELEGGTGGGRRPDRPGWR